MFTGCSFRDNVLCIQIKSVKQSLTKLGRNIVLFNLFLTSIKKFEFLGKKQFFKNSFEHCWHGLKSLSLLDNSKF